MTSGLLMPVSYEVAAPAGGDGDVEMLESYTNVPEGSHPAIQPKNAALQQLQVDSSKAIETMEAQQPTMLKSINLSAFNEIVDRIEHADMEDMTTFFDPKKHGNWAGPDQWHSRRYRLALLTMQRQREKKLAAEGRGPSTSVAAAGDGDVEMDGRP